jgi:glycosyltransferase involved in cell wall biosynthesis
MNLKQQYLIVTGDFVTTGGMDRANFFLADYLARCGNPVHLVAYRVDRSLLKYPNVIFHRVPKVANSYSLSNLLLDYTGRYWAKKVSGLGGRVIVNGGNCYACDINWVHYIHRVYSPETKGNFLQLIKRNLDHQLALNSELKIIPATQKVIANSQFTAKGLVDSLGINSSKIRTVYYGIDSSCFYAADDSERKELRDKLNWNEKPVVLFIGALGDRRKGFDVLFKSWQKLKAEVDWDVNLKVVGRGGELPLWERRIAGAGMQDDIEFLGFRTDVPELMRAADCLVSPTRYEAYGLGVHEAICCGLPAIVSQNAGVAERYPENLSDLLLPNPENSDDLAAKLLNWHNNRSEFQARVKPFAIALGRYSWDDMARDFLKAIELD